jgi:hypothetical protein
VAVLDGRSLHPRGDGETDGEEAGPCMRLFGRSLEARFSEVHIAPVDVHVRVGCEWPRCPRKVKSSTAAVARLG